MLLIFISFGGRLFPFQSAALWIWQTRADFGASETIQDRTKSSCPRTSAPAKETAEWSTPVTSQQGYSSPFIVRLHPYANILKLKLSAQFTTYATNPQWIAKLKTFFFSCPLIFFLLDSRFSQKERDICLKKFSLAEKRLSTWLSLLYLRLCRKPCRWKKICKHSITRSRTHSRSLNKSYTENVVRCLLGLIISDWWRSEHFKWISCAVPMYLTVIYNWYYTVTLFLTVQLHKRIIYKICTILKGKLKISSKHLFCGPTSSLFFFPQSQNAVSHHKCYT